MSSLIKYHEGRNSVAVIGNYSPRQCGIATFTTDVVEALSAESTNIDCWAVVMNDIPEGYQYPEKVHFEINQNKFSDYSVAAEFLNINQIDIVCLQHEYGIFGGPAGSNILKLLSDLRMPVVTTLHTILKDPPPEYREVTNKLVTLSDKLVVMSEKTREFLIDIYSVPEEKIAFIHHGIHDTPFVDPNFYKDQFGVEGKKVLLTFGLLSPNKGIEYMIKALPEVIKQHPDVTYIILGATHPHVLRVNGEEYRISLQQLAQNLKVSEHVIFQNRFVELKELCEFLGAADLYITPYVEEAQIVSGALIYAMGTGKATISTPYWYASEMLSEERGRIVPFKNPDALAEQVIDLFDNDVARHTIRKNAYTFCREAIWKEVARKYLQVFTEVRHERSRQPHLTRFPKTPEPVTTFELPELKLDHLKILTDETGVLQHATHTIPDRTHGYCTDDNARALLVSTMASQFSPSDENLLYSLRNCYLSFLQYAFNDETGRFRNFMTYSRQWTEDQGSEDSYGRALWGLGMAVAYLEDPGQLAMIATLLDKVIKPFENARDSRALAFALVGIHAYLRRFSGDSEVKRIRAVMANRLFKRFKKYVTKDWPWLENKLTYANGKLPHALLLSGQWMQRGDMVDMGLNTLEWLMKIQTEDGHFVPVGNNGWYEKGGIKTRFDQQPIEAHAMIEASIEAFNVTREKKWIDTARICFNWFLGQNDLNTPLYDPKTGGCRDGLMADGVNQNEGAESTLAWLLSLIAMHKLSADNILIQPSPPINTRKGRKKKSK